MIRITGMNSGLDTDSIIQELVKASSEKKTKLEKAQTKHEWKQEAWKTLNTKVKKFYDKFLDNMKYESSFRKKSTKIADESIAKVVASGNAVKGSQTLAVTQLAKAGYLTGGKLDGSVKGTSSMKEIGALADGETAKINVNGNDIVISSNMKVNDFLQKLSDSGVEASFDETNQRFFISAKETGESKDFTITHSDANGLSLLKNLKLLTKEDILEKSDYQTWANMSASELNTRVEDEAAVRARKYYDKTQVLKQTNDELRNEITDIQTEQSNYASSQEFMDAMAAADPSGILTAEEVKAQLETKISMIKTEKNRYNELSAKDPSELTTDEQNELADLESRRSSWDSLEQDENNLAAVKKYTDYTAQIDNYNTTIATNEATIATNETYFSTADGGVTITAEDTLKDTVRAEFEAKIQNAQDMVAEANALTSDGNSAVRILGADAKILLNGAEFTSTSNSFSVNGLTITAQGLSAKDANGEYVTTTVNTTEDVDGIYNMIKEFLTEYNSLIKEMDTLYNAESAKDYEPLTSEEKEEMSDDEIEKWEKKIKDALLRRDSNLNTVISSLKNGMSKSYTVNGKNYSLSSFGINTLSYFKAADNERGLYHIDGDTDDDATSANEDKLKTAIADDPDAVVGFFTQLARDMWTSLDKQMTSTDNRSKYSIYDDKRMKEEYNDYKDKISKQEKKLQAMEDKYYKQFAAMETAMAKLNSQQSSLSSLFGS